MRRPEVQDLPKDQRRKFFLQWTAEPFTSDALEVLEYDESKHVHAYGTVRPHVFSVQTEGNVARVDDCSDQTGLYYKDTRTGETVEPHAEDRKDFYWTATFLKKKPVGWRITGNKTVDKPCNV